jgi:hypothetical protein
MVKKNGKSNLSRFLSGTAVQLFRNSLENCIKLKKRHPSPKSSDV